MDSFFDATARILASPMPRRQAFRLIGSALAATVLGVLGQKSAAAAKPPSCVSPQYSCGNGVANSICCNPGTCCAKHGNDAACCLPGQCTCGNGTCASSSGGRCASGCTVCT